MVTAFDHATIVVTDLDEARRFFAILGFKESQSVVVNGEAMSEFMGIPGWQADHVTLTLTGSPTHQEVQLLRFHRPDATPDPASGDLRRTGFNHLCFRVADLDACVRAMRASGFETRNAVMAFHDRRLVFLSGPSGVVIELAEWQRDPDAQGA